MQCGKCRFLSVVDKQQYHDCRYDSPRVVVSAFKPNPTMSDQYIGKIMTVWPRVSVDELGCGKYEPKISDTTNQP